MTSVDRYIARLREIGIATTGGRQAVSTGFAKTDEGSFNLAGFYLDGDRGFAFILGLMAVVQAPTFAEVDGKVCWVVVARDNAGPRIERLEPLFKAEGTPFDLAAWRASFHPTGK